ncbi:sugar-binding transcriptional regulator [Rhodococcoides fascians]|uniref:sugar-binding transcriptional regulator n=1 Tax=Rhodococcoides fascians TaxID=1828 RepID=UPI00055E1E64|nr:MULTISPECIES: sugar-binding domain-containing protein [Rhodococcus]OZE96494.1 DNA-binding transcriptional regulator [Rhodococcus sp. 15-1189-1-1a]OZF11540.1 DNA-binding transcriptional regulator [Rhodococcus sp. 14-2686-1-2]
MPEQNVPRVGPEELTQRGLVARRYYLDGRTRIQIADELGLSRFKIARILEDAVTSGMVEIKVHAPESIDIELSRALKDTFGLRMAFAVRTGGDEQDVLWDAVGRVTADLLSEIVTSADVLGVDCGRTLSRMTTHLNSIATCDVVQLTGMAGAVSSTSAELVRRITELGSGHAWSMYAPLVVADSRTGDALRGSRGIQETLKHHASVTKAVVSIGAWKPGLSQVYDLLSPDEAQELTAKGVVAESCALLLDSDGNRVDGLDDRRIGVSEEDLRGIADVVAIVAGEKKLAAVRSVLKSGLVSSLIIDATTAAGLLR